MKKSIITFTLIIFFSIGLSLEANAAASTNEPCTEENAEQIQREQSKSIWSKMWGEDGFFFFVR